MNHSIVKIIIVILLLSLNQANADHFSVTWDGGGNGHSWADKDNWTPDIVPNNRYLDTYSATINDAHVVLDDYYDVNLASLTIGGDVELWSRLVQVLYINDIFSIGANDSLELSDIHLFPNGTVTNNGSIDFQHRSMIKSADLINYGNVNSNSMSNASIDGKLTNHGSVSVSPYSNFSTNDDIDNYGLIGLYGGLFSSDGTLNNTVNGSIKGFGVMGGLPAINNAGTITAWGGTLTVATSSGTFTNTGTLKSSDLTSLLIAADTGTTPQDFHNSGMIDIGTSGGVAFDCNLVNDPLASIKLNGGTLAATTITQAADANFSGFGKIAGDIEINTGGLIQLTGPTDIIGDVTVMAGATLEVKDGQTLITGHTTNDGTIHLIGGTVIFQGGYSGTGSIINDAGIDRNHFDTNNNGIVNIEDFASLAASWLWQASWSDE